ncbi:helix-turn-helix transcriptional regulator [Rhizobium oryzicola]|uniref:AraC family transcriptional regulator n=1 Tax=Rhizobium oryzicola TaxID=1232668 RepID=A0ABT8SY78_9HYPH|nr:AraC family transcriptional regulator [Rhizobium oryzicola]MDO1583306.1 AraC family transcriptional regulator [Rhizobium oryzicola]
MIYPSPTKSLPQADLYGEMRLVQVLPSLGRQRIQLLHPRQRHFHHLLFVASGDAILDGEREHPHAGPSFILSPTERLQTATFFAGAEGMVIGLSPQLLADAIGNQPESASLRAFCSQALVLRLGDSTAVETRTFLLQIAREWERPRYMSRMTIAASLRLILIGAWQASETQPSVHPSRRGRDDLLQRFRQLVETSFRQQMSIARYAEGLGVSPDRLHAICTRQLKRSPLDLVHERLVREAQFQLERSARSVQDIAESLGFRDPSNFSHFFKKKTGLSPLNYRNRMQRSAGRDIAPADYHDWP